MSQSHREKISTKQLNRNIVQLSVGEFNIDDVKTMKHQQNMTEMLDHK